MAMDAESFYTPGGVQTTARVPGFMLPGLEQGGGSAQLMALLNPALAFKQQMAQAQMDLALRGADREDQALGFEQQMRKQAQLQALQDRDFARNQAEQMRIQSYDDQRRAGMEGRAAEERSRLLDGREEVYGQTVGGMNSMPGFITGVGSPGAHGFGFAGYRTRGSGFGRTGGGSMQGSGSGTPFGVPVENSLATEAERVRALNIEGSSGPRPGMSSISSYRPSYSADFTRPPGARR